MYTTLWVRQQGYPDPSRTIAYFLHNMHKTNFLVSGLKSLFPIAYNSQQLLFSGKCEFVKM